MLNKSLLLSLLFLLSSYVAYVQYEAKKQVQSQYEQLKTDIDSKEKELLRQYKISVKAEQVKLIAENQSLELQEQLNDALKNNVCANELVPSDIANQLQQRASNIRQAATNTSEPTK